MRVWILVLLFPFVELHAQPSVSIDTAKSVIHWKGTKMLRMGKHEGDIRLSSGKFQVINNQITGGSFSIDMNSIMVTDIPSHETEAIANLTNHLKSNDFFYTEAYPEAKFRITEVTDNKRVARMLTIRGISHEIMFEMKTERIGQKGWKIIADLTFDRQRWNVSFKGLKDMAIDDLVYLSMEIYSQ